MSSFKYYALFHLLKLFLPGSHWVSTAFVVLAILWEAFASPLFQKNLYVHHFPSTDLFLLSYMAKGLGIISAIICITLFIPNLAAFMVLPPTTVFKWHDFWEPPEVNGFFIAKSSGQFSVLTSLGLRVAVVTRNTFAHDFKDATPSCAPSPLLTGLLPILVLPHQNEL